MEKKHIIRFLKEKKRGAYSLLVELYSDVVTEIPITMALTVIKEDLEKESATSVDLHYFSLAKAISRFKKRVTKGSGILTARKIEFKDSYEMKDSQSGPGRFKLSESKVKDVQ